MRCNAMLPAAAAFSSPRSTCSGVDTAVGAHLIVMSYAFALQPAFDLEIVINHLGDKIGEQQLAPPAG
jgi:hypothetical protein